MGELAESAKYNKPAKFKQPDRITAPDNIMIDEAIILAAIVVCIRYYVRLNNPKKKIYTKLHSKVVDRRDKGDRGDREDKGEREYYI
ncbi:MAG TPA: hypothetical protein DD379_13225 [Cyanobacteria bacterium UBA11162]|nr:hypothetical protein [Cyanobacteria bacterium UBA11162]